MLKRLTLVALCCLLFTTPSFAQRRRPERRKPAPEEAALMERLNAHIKEHWQEDYESLFPRRTQLSDLQIGDATLALRFSTALSYMPIRPETEYELRTFVQPILDATYSDYQIEFFIERTPLETLVLQPQDPAAGPRVEPYGGPALVRQIDPPGPRPTAGLDGKHLLVAASHGWMYDSAKSFRWEWQRARLFNTVEDMHSISYIVPLLIPMLERSGAVVFHARERDWQTHEVVLDDGDAGRRRSSAGRVRAVGNWRLSNATGFKSGLAPYPDAFNPHAAGSVHTKKTRSRTTGRFEWIPQIPESGEYGLYISYSAAPDRATDARYTVHHLGGQTSFLVNQTMGGNTWIWLGRFRFAEGTNPRSGKVVLSNESNDPGATVSADAVKFGGGMGDVVRGGKTSGYPRYLEGSRYWLQYAGAPPELTYKMGWESGYEGPDYTDDFTCRVEWVNYLRGAPYGPNPNRAHLGLGVPMDLFFSFHTDAGISDGIVGTLMIYRSRGQEGDNTFPDGRSRQINRELGDLIQTQMVSDIRSLYTSTWSRRQLRDGNYSETRRGNVPSCLVELMSHQNFHDMKYGLDPRFQRDCARAIYKGMLRFIAREYGYEPVVVPLPPTHLSVRQSGEDRALLQWKPQNDPLEPTATPAGYIVYKRTEDGGFDNGIYVEGQSATLEGLEADTLYSFQVEAVNSGGRSFPSETLAVALGKRPRRALIVYGFDRIGGASTVIAPGYQGFDSADRGVGDQYYFGRTGFQYDFDPESKFVSNDAPGHGTTSGEIENRMELGNTFDYVARHGKAFVDNGWAFDSVSDEAVESGAVNLSDYPLVDWVLGEQRTQPVPAGFVSAGTPDRMQPMFRTFTGPMQAALVEYATAGGALLVSGAYVATDLAETAENATQDEAFLKNILHVEHVTNHGSKTNRLVSQPGGLFDGMEAMRFAEGLGEDGVYGVELPDAIDPVKDSGGKTVLRYADRNFSAGVIHEATPTGARTLVLGFPFETVIGEENRAKLLGRALEFLAP